MNINISPSLIAVVVVCIAAFFLWAAWSTKRILDLRHPLASSTTETNGKHQWVLIMMMGFIIGGCLCFIFFAPLSNFVQALSAEPKKEEALAANSATKWQTAIQTSDEASINGKTIEIGRTSSGFFLRIPVENLQKLKLKPIEDALEKADITDCTVAKIGLVASASGDLQKCFAICKGAKTVLVPLNTRDASGDETVNIETLLQDIIDANLLIISNNQSIAVSRKAASDDKEKKYPKLKGIHLKPIITVPTK